MKEQVICLWSHGRRPVRATPEIGMVDVQGSIPAGWCNVCGAEVYRSDRRRCGRCRRSGAGRSIYALCEPL